MLPKEAMTHSSRHQAGGLLALLASGSLLLTSGAAVAQAGGRFEQATAVDTEELQYVAVARCLFQGGRRGGAVLLDDALGKRTDHLQGM